MMTSILSISRSIHTTGMVVYKNAKSCCFWSVELEVI